jgi:di/tricarboxylate transporter
VEDSAPPRLGKFWLACLLTVAMLVVFTAGVTSLLICAFFAAALMVIFGILSQQEARDAINWEVYLTVATAFGIGTALTNSGVAKVVADFLVRVGTGIGLGDAGLYGAVYLATFLISNIVTNNAAAALVFPIAMDAADQTSADRLLMAYTLMLGASASFMSPFGYTTNLLIYGPGGYKYMDFVYIGTPMQIVLWVLSVAVLAANSLPWYMSWLITLAFFVVVAAVRLTNCGFGKAASSKVKQNRSHDHGE